VKAGGSSTVAATVTAMHVTDFTADAGAPTDTFQVIVKGTAATLHIEAAARGLELHDAAKLDACDWGVGSVTAPLVALQAWFGEDLDRGAAVGSLLWFGPASEWESA
jgi:hypothetical protein